MTMSDRKHSWTNASKCHRHAVISDVTWIQLETGTFKAGRGCTVDLSSHSALIFSHPYHLNIQRSVFLTRLSYKNGAKTRLMHVSHRP